jgi:predicted nucleic acid-binding protein
MPTAVSVSVIRSGSGSVLPARAYLDTNFLLNSRDRDAFKYRAAGACLAELLGQGVELHVSPLVFDELWWALFKKSYEFETGKPLTPRLYKDNRRIWQNTWPTIKRISDELLASGRFKILTPATNQDLVAEATELMTLNPLSPRDAFHLAITLHHGIQSFVTCDADFDGLRMPTGKNVTIVKF